MPPKYIIVAMMEKLTFTRVTGQNKDFISLVEQLNAELAIIDGDDHDFYNQYNGLEEIHHVVLLYDKDSHIACGAIKKQNDSTMEIKRMYTAPSFRGKGVASKILQELEHWAAELKQKQLVLETGKRQEDAIALYTKNGYKLISNYGPYVGVENSCCFKKELDQ